MLITASMHQSATIRNMDRTAVSQYMVPNWTLILILCTSMRCGPILVLFGCTLSHNSCTLAQKKEMAKAELLRVSTYSSDAT